MYIVLEKGGKIDEFDALKHIPSMCGFEYREDKKDLAKLIYNHYFDRNESSSNSTSLEDVILFNC